MPRLVIAGCGYIGRAVGRLFHEKQWEVVGLTHSHESAAQPGAPFPLRACDITERARVESDLADLVAPDLLLDCVSSGKGGADNYRRVYLEGARNLIDLLRPARFVFTSSTSVYAQIDGSVVTEESAAEPGRETGLILRETENLVLAHGGTVARLAGIYGPGRSILLQRFFDGTALIEGDGSRIINQAHRDDVAAALVVLGTHPAARGQICNVADDEPMSQLECYRWLASHFGKPLPPNGPIDTNRKRGWTSKRVSNARLHGLGWSCLFPSFRAAVVRDSRLIPALSP